MPWTTLRHSRLPLPDERGTIGDQAVILDHGLRLNVQPMSPEQLPDVSGEVLYRSYLGMATKPLDVRIQDRLEDVAHRDPLTKQPVLYIVRGVQQWGQHHVEVWLERTQGAGPQS